MSTENGEGPTGTPIHLWIVGVVAVLWNSMGAMDYVMTQSRNEAYMAKFTPEQLEFFYGFPAWLDGAWAIAVWGGVLGSLLLLLKKRAAVAVFMVSLAGMIITTVHNYFIANGFEVVGDAVALAFSGLIFVAAIALVVYSRRMANEGVLT